MNRILIALIFCLSLPAHAHAWPGVVLEVLDGDTIVVAPNGDTTSPISVRLAGIDAPELSQPYGKEALEWVQRKIPVGTQVEIVSYSGDKYRRAIGLVQVGGKSINGEMVRQGLAWVYDGYVSGRMGSLWKRWQREAKKAKRGLWQDKKPERPDLWRKRKEHK